jgi:hypothetical protein
MRDVREMRVMKNPIRIHVPQIPHALHVTALGRKAAYAL